MLTKIPIAAIQGISATPHSANQLLRKKPSRKKNWRILSLWREVRKHKIDYYFLSQNQLVISPLQYGRGAVTIGIEKINVPGAGFSVDYYSIRDTQCGNKLSLNCTCGVSLLKKLVRFNLIQESELKGDIHNEKYEPYRYCDLCGERVRVNSTICDTCGEKLS